MGQTSNFFEERLKKQAEVTPILRACPKRVEACKNPADKARLDAELAKRLDEFTPTSDPDPDLSCVEQAMRRNAPDLAGAPEAEVHAAQERRTAHLRARWPRPRTVSLVLIGMILWLHPQSTVQLFVGAFALFLITSMAVGPERARDGSYFLGRRVLRYWKVELALAGKLGRSLQGRLVRSRNQAQ